MIEKEIAKNRILLENLFVLFVYINNKIPLLFVKNQDEVNH